MMQLFLITFGVAYNNLTNILVNPGGVIENLISESLTIIVWMRVEDNKILRTLLGKISTRLKKMYRVNTLVSAINSC